MSRKEQQHGGVKLTAKTARTLAMQEFGTARGMTKSTSFVGAYFMEFGNLRIEICADAACIAVRVVLAHGTGSSVKYFDPDTLQENFKAIVTALNFIGSYVLWGDETACFPADTDVKNYFISVSRMFGWVARSVILTYWSKIDKKMTRRLIDSIVDSVNIWLNGLVSEEKLLGARVEFLDEENSTTALMAGKAVFHIYMTPASPMRECEFVLEYDADYVTAALSA